MIKISQSVSLVLLAALGTVQAQAAGQPENPTFTIDRYAVQGNKTLTQAEIDRLLKPFLGEGKEFSDVQHALEAIENAYRDAGFGAAQVSLPEQTLSGGVVRIDIIEPVISEVTFPETRYFDERNLQRALSALGPGGTPNTRQLAEAVRFANLHPSRQIGLSLQQGDLPDSVKVKLAVQEESPLRFFLTSDNSGNDQTGLTRLGLGVQHSNLFNRDHKAQLQYVTSPGHTQDVSIWGAGYSVPFYTLRDSLNFFAGYSDVNSGTLQDLFTLSGKGTVIGGRYDQSLTSRRNGFSHHLSYGVEQRKYDNTLGLVGGGALGGLAPDYQLRLLSLTYGAQFASGDAVTDVSAGVAHNLPAGALGDEAALQAVRSNVKAAYNLVKLSAQYQRKLPLGMGLRLAYTGQLTADPLPPGDQFGLGGAASVRGYEERETANDSGHLVNIEWSTPAWSTQWAGNSFVQPLLFLDAGRVQRNDPLAGETKSTSLRSLGIGLRGGVGKYLQMRVDVARAMVDGITTLKGDTRLHASLVASY